MVNRISRSLGHFLIRPAVIGLSFTTFTGSSSHSAVTAAPSASADPIRQARYLASDEKIEDAYRTLAESIKNETDKAKRAPREMALGVLYFDQGRVAEAETALQQSIDDGIKVDDYAHFYLGLIKLRTSRFEQARADLNKVLSSTAPQPTRLEAQYHIAESYLAEKNWRAAANQLELLRRKWRAHELYPTVVYGLLRAELNGGRGKNSCKWARELYTKYPTLPVVNEWATPLEKNTVDGKQVQCSASDNDLRMRIRRLQWGGESERALAEIKALQKAEPGYSTDSLLASHLINEGQTDEAMKILLKHYDAEKDRPGYLQLLAKAASRAGDYASSAGLYYKAYEIAPRSKNSSNALFQSAFTAYQMQDYDGASRRFEKFLKTFSGSKLARDSQWHLAWIRYLRSDYTGALESLKKIASAPKIKTRRGRKAAKTDSVSTDRVRYWMAMSYWRLGRMNEALPIFQQLVRDPAVGYYAIASYQRLLSIPGGKVPPGVETRLGLHKAEGTGPVVPTEEEVQAAAEAEEAAEGDYVASEPADAETETADAENEEAAGDGTEITEAKDEADPASFGNVVLSRRFERSRELSLMGLEDAARRELLEVERSARSQNERRALVSEYQQVRNFYRSSYMGDVGFSGVRVKHGLRGEGRPFWEYAYPRAYDATVTEASKSTTVPEEFIWGIMRAESHFRQDARSAVGALGLMQIMPFTGRQLAQLMNWKNFETGSLLTPETNIRLGSRYLQRLLEKFAGSVPLAAASYNAGPHRVHAWVRNFGSLDMDEFVEHIPFVETRNYVKKVVRNHEIYNLLYSGGAHSARWLAKPVGVVVDDKIPTREVW